MPIVPLVGHRALTQRFSAAIGGGQLPQSILLHGDAGVGKQRLALWLANALLCEGDSPPCGACRHCRYVADLTHPDLLWAFPRPRLKDSDATPDDVRQDLGAAIAERVAAHGLYAAPPGNEGLYVPTIRMIVRAASVTPAMARRRVIIVGDAERMVSQEGSDQAANAFLKLLEEPGHATWVVLTSSTPGALLPTIRSRLVAFRVPRLTTTEVEAWLSIDEVAAALHGRQLAGGRTQWAELAAGAPGRLLASGANATATDAARRIIAAATGGDREKETRVALSQGAAGARGAFTETLEAVGVELRASLAAAVHAGDDALARGLARCIEFVEDAKALAHGNANPQLVTSALMTQLRTLARSASVGAPARSR